jgi:hypothetical protein
MPRKPLPPIVRRSVPPDDFIITDPAFRQATAEFQAKLLRETVERLKKPELPRLLRTGRPEGGPPRKAAAMRQHVPPPAPAIIADPAAAFANARRRKGRGIR